MVRVVEVQGYFRADCVYYIASGEIGRVDGLMRQACRGKAAGVSVASNQTAPTL